MNGRNAKLVRKYQFDKVDKMWFLRQSQKIKYGVRCISRHPDFKLHEPYVYYPPESK